MKKWNPGPGRISFNPRTPCGVRHQENMQSFTQSPFQSTHSLRRATGGWVKSPTTSGVSIHALLAEGDLVMVPSGRMVTVSIHALLAEGDLVMVPSGRMVTVSIHALLAEGDMRRQWPRLQPWSFNPRTPCGGRLRLTIYIVIQQRKRYFAPTSRRRPSSPSLLF